MRSTVVLTWRRTPIPAKIAFAGGNTCSRAFQRVALKRAQSVVTYHPNTIAEGRRECVQNINCGIQPLCPFVVGALSLIKGLYLGPKYGEYGTGRVAGLQLGG